MRGFDHDSDVAIRWSPTNRRAATRKVARARRLLFVVGMRALAIVAAIATAAHADDVPPPTRAAGIELSAGYAGGFDSLHFKRRGEAGLFVRVGEWQVTATMPWLAIDSGNVERDGPHLGDIALGGRIAYRVPVSSAIATVAIGLERHWIYGHDSVTRHCMETQTCVAGFYVEKPSYRSWVPQVRLGVGLDHRSGSSRRTFSLELIVERYDLSGLPPDGLSGIAVLGAVTGTFARGWN